jgi:hypothetical protein
MTAFLAADNYPNLPEVPGSRITPLRHLSGNGSINQPLGKLSGDNARPDGFTDSMRAATPDTTGAAHEVPPPKAYVATPLST